MFHHHLIRRAAVAGAILMRCAVPSIATQQSTRDATPEAAFIAENNAAMATMMNGMTITPTGDVDRDFATMMIAHHQGAIDMARAELGHGTNEQLRRIAQEIIVNQIQEIAAMHVAVGDPPLTSRAAPTIP